MRRHHQRRRAGTMESGVVLPSPYVHNCTLCFLIEAGRLLEVRRLFQTGQAACQCWVNHSVYRTVRFYQGFLRDSRTDDSVAKARVWKSGAVYGSATRALVLETCANLMAAGAPINYTTGVETPLMAALTTCDEDLLWLLLDFKANVNQSDGQEDINALGLAILLNEVTLVEILLKHGAKVNAVCCGNLVPIQLAMNKNAAVSSLLIQYGADVHQLRSVSLDDRLFTSQSPLNVAILRKNVHLCRLLLEHGEDVNQTFNDTLESPIHQAVRNLDMDMISLLLEYGADLNRPNSERHTPLGLALMMDSDPLATHIAKKLVLAGASANQKTGISYFQKTYSPLHIACFQGNLEFVRFLVEEVCTRAGFWDEEIEASSAQAEESERKRPWGSGRPSGKKDYPPASSKGSQECYFKLLRRNARFWGSTPSENVGVRQGPSTSSSSSSFQLDSQDFYVRSQQSSLSPQTMSTTAAKELWKSVTKLRWYPSRSPDTGSSSSSLQTMATAGSVSDGRGSGRDRSGSTCSGCWENRNDPGSKDDVRESQNTQEFPRESLNTQESPKESPNTQDSPKDSTDTQESPNTQDSPKNSPDTHESHKESPNTQESPKDSPDTQESHKDSPDTQESHKGSPNTQGSPKESPNTQEESPNSEEHNNIVFVVGGEPIKRPPVTDKWMVHYGGDTQCECCEFCLSPDVLSSASYVLCTQGTQTEKIFKNFNVVSLLSNAAQTPSPPTRRGLFGFSRKKKRSGLSKTQSLLNFEALAITDNDDDEEEEEEEDESKTLVYDDGDDGDRDQHAQRYLDQEGRVVMRSVSTQTHIRAKVKPLRYQGAAQAQAATAAESGGASASKSPVFQKEFGAPDYDFPWQAEQWRSKKKEAGGAGGGGGGLGERKNHTVARFLNQVGNDGSTALFMAVYDGNVELVDYLLQNGADPHFSSQHGNFFHAAVLSQSVPLLRRALELRCDINEVNMFGNSPLTLLSRLDLADACDLLVSHGADMNSRDRYGETPLLASVYFGCEMNARTLIQHGAALDLMDENHTSAIYWSIFNNRQRTLKLLLMAGTTFTPQVFRQYPRNIRVMNNKPLFQFIYLHVHQPRSLQDMTTIRIRTHLGGVMRGRSILKAVDLLPLPNRLKDVLHLKHFIEIIDSHVEEPTLAS